MHGEEHWPTSSCGRSWIVREDLQVRELRHWTADLRRPAHETNRSMDRQTGVTVAALSGQSQFTGAYCFFSAVRSRL